MREELGEIAVVGQDQQARCIDVEPADRVKKGVDALYQFQYRLPGVRVRARARITRGFIKEDIYFLRSSLNRLSVESYNIALGVSLGAQFGYNLTIDRDPTGSDYSLAMAT